MSEVNAESTLSAQNIIQALRALSLENLSEVKVLQVSSASRKSQSIMETAAASYVITQEDIRRAGISVLPEALRLVPGVQVARIDTNKWAISARGFNARFASKLLVMIDGRTIYTPLRAEVNWDAHNLLLEDVDRIEVIRGPGASLWGANAVNGIINIITKAACDTQGGLVSTTLGSGEEKGILGIRYGGKLPLGHYRLYSKLHVNDSALNEQGIEQEDDWHTKQIGLRVDQAVNRDAWDIETEYYETTYQRFDRKIQQNKQIKAKNAHILGRWKRELTDGSLQLQSYFTHTQRDDLLYSEKRDLYDIDFQHNIERWQTQSIIWGLGFRYTKDHIVGTPTFYYSPDRRTDNIFSAFVQHEWQFAEQWRLTMGTKLEHNDYTGFEVQPSVRLLWTPRDYYSVWAALSRAVKTPSRTGTDFHMQTGSPRMPIYIDGNTTLESETLLAYELGHRFQPNARFSFDLSLFLHKYRDVVTVGEPHFVAYPNRGLYYKNENALKGHSYGTEFAAKWQITSDFKVALNYSYLKEQDVLRAESISPKQQINAQIYWNINSQWSWNHNIYYTSKIPDTDIAAYTRWDTNMGWKISRDLNINVGIRNLLDKQHREFLPVSGIDALETPRSFYAKVQYRF
ncbi:TonB-dependent receptor [Candidatus Albibeggiatoa sp. nov. NOAA]|uniref:TonB-dependent receptor plug domain-containing protein n=1 Tax=Candidatus Albibeggiatoa sp. nov. NOAA TaxID=3162724 RepID=UPI0032FDDF0A|nr:TonB-dependent receptor [Thiotrichaceae bacterium]